MEPKPPQLPPQEPKTLERIPEYDFERGAEEAVSRIIAILKKQHHCIVGFSGSSTEVGKSTLSKRIAGTLYDRGKIPVRIYHGIGPEEQERIEKGIKEGARVFIFDQLSWGTTHERNIEKEKKWHNRDISSVFGKNGLQVEGVDLWIGIYSPKRPFVGGTSFRPVADILVRNDKAKIEK